MIIDVRETKERIKQLKKLKNQMQVGSSARKSLNKKLREEKTKLEQAVNLTTDKQEMIKRLYLLKPNLKVLRIDLEKFTEEQLQKHLDKILIKKGGNNA